MNLLPMPKADCPNIYGGVHSAKAMEKYARANVEADRALRQAGSPTNHPALDRQYSIDPLDGLYAAFLALPVCSLMGVIGSAIQEIQSLRQAEQDAAIDAAIAQAVKP